MGVKRLRRTAALRRLANETRLHPSDFILPVFVEEGLGASTPIASLTGHSRHSAAAIADLAKEALDRGLGGILLFGIPASKTDDGRNAAHPDGPVQQAIRVAKATAPELAVITDVCVCSYTQHGHCGVIVDGRPNDVLSSQVLGEIAVSHAQAGADLVAPSAMMDGQVLAIRNALDGAGFGETPVLAYCCKFASGLYGPFRDAADSTPAFGDRRGYQIPFSNAEEALREAEASEREGADMLMVKPGLPYLDVISRVKALTSLPVVAYQVSGEYAMIDAASERGWMDRRTVALETLTALKRAGAHSIITYFAMEAADWLA